MLEFFFKKNLANLKIQVEVDNNKKIWNKKIDSQKTN